MKRNEEILLSLTGPMSHTLIVEPGVGAIEIGPKEVKPDLIVNPCDRINWNSFDDKKSPDGSLWPSVIRYFGNDISIFNWAEEREIETLSYTAYSALHIDASQSKIRILAVDTQDYETVLKLPSSEICNHCGIKGDLSKITLTPTNGIPPMRFTLNSSDSGDSIQLPKLESLRNITDIEIACSPLGTPFDCSSLLQFPELKRLSLQGSLTKIETLEELKLTSIQYRYVPDLTGLSLENFPELKSIIIWNCDESEGKILRSQLKKRKLEGYTSVSQLRSKRWFIEEYGLPFSAWPKKTARAATKAFKSASKVISKAEESALVESEIVSFIQVMNGLDNIETGEREDILEAVILLNSFSQYECDVEDIFESYRDF